MYLPKGQLLPALGELRHVLGFRRMPRNQLFQHGERPLIRVDRLIAFSDFVLDLTDSPPGAGHAKADGGRCSLLRQQPLVIPHRLLEHGSPDAVELRTARQILFIQLLEQFVDRLASAFQVLLRVLTLLNGFGSRLLGSGGLPHADELHKVLQVTEVKGQTAQGSQREFMGLILPTTKDLDLINLARAKGWVAGIVNTKERGTSKFGPYYVYTLLPEGAVWTRGAYEDVEVGDKVKVRAKADTGKILELLPLY